MSEAEFYLYVFNIFSQFIWLLSECNTIYCTEITASFHGKKTETWCSSCSSLFTELLSLKLHFCIWNKSNCKNEYSPSCNSIPAIDSFLV